MKFNFYEVEMNMKTVYNQPDNNGYTEKAYTLEREVRTRLKDIIRRELDNGYPIESIEYVIFHAVTAELFRQKAFKKIGRNIEGQKIE